MKKLGRFGIILLLIIIAFSFYFFASKDKKDNGLSQACFDRTCFYVETAKTAEARSRGLMFRQELAADQAMLFIFETPGVYKFWMKDTLIPLDIIWLDSEKQVVFIEPEAQPCFKENCPLFGPETLAQYVLEINGGLAEEFNIKAGDKVDFF